MFYISNNGKIVMFKEQNCNICNSKGLPLNHYLKMVLYVVTVCNIRVYTYAQSITGKMYNYYVNSVKFTCKMYNNGV